MAAKSCDLILDAFWRIDGMNKRRKIENNEGEGEKEEKRRFI